MAVNNLFKGPGDKDLKKIGIPTDQKSESNAHPWPKLQGGGRARTGPKAVPQEETDSAPLEMMAPETVAEKKKPKAILKKMGWVEEKTLFNTDAEIFAEFEVSESEKHRSLVEFQLWVDKDGEYVIQERTQGHLDDKGRATAKVPIRKGNTLESTFALKAKHCSGDFPDKPSADRVVTDAAEITCARTQVSGLHFPKDKSFIGDEYLDVLCEVKKTYQTWKETHPKAQIVIFGHSEADKDGEAHALSKTRAYSAFLFLIGDVDGWAELGERERWGCWEQQCMLRVLGFFHTKPTGSRGTTTRKATEDFIHFLNEKRGKKFNPMLGFMESYIRKELYREYMNHKREGLGLPSSAFRLVSGYPYVGCSAFNRYLSGEELHAENRRAVFVILEESENFPMTFPCKSGTIGPCEDQTKRPGERAIAGFRCKFYDEMVKKEKTGRTAVSGNGHEIETHWPGYPTQNDFNDEIYAAAEKHNLDSLIFKSLIAQESHFEADIANNAGYAGLTQVGGLAIGEADLKIGKSAKVGNEWVYDHKGDERFDPKKSIEAGASILSTKRNRINNLVLRHFEKSPSEDEKWNFYLAAYNGGEGIVLEAWKENGSVDCTWEDLIDPKIDIKKTPLYKALVPHYDVPAMKFKEISEYPIQIIQRKNS